MSTLEMTLERLQDRLGSALQQSTLLRREITVEVAAADLLTVCAALRDEPDFAFDVLIDVCAVDYLTFGQYDWEGEDAPTSSFNRGTRTPANSHPNAWKKPRFAVVTHLLSTTLNRRLRIKVFLDEANLSVPSLTGLWPAANWFEREAFDMFGVWFEGHPDLRRILTDYGFIGHPFRKDFPLIGTVEMRYDAAAGRCVYEPVSIEPRTLVPRVYREDNRYEGIMQASSTNEGTNA